MLQGNLPVVDTIHREKNMFATGKSKLIRSPDNYLFSDTTDQLVTFFVLDFNVVVLPSIDVFIPCHPIHTVFQPGFIF